MTTKNSTKKHASVNAPSLSFPRLVSAMRKRVEQQEEQKPLDQVLVPVQKEGLCVVPKRKEKANLERAQQPAVAMIAAKQLLRNQGDQNE